MLIKPNKLFKGTIYKSFFTFILSIVLLMSFCMFLLILLFAKEIFTDIYSFTGIDLREHVNSITYLLNRHMVSIFLFTVFVSFGGAMLISSIIEKRIINTIMRIKSDIKKIKSFEDLRSFNLTNYDAGFEELNEITKEFLELVEKVNRLAVSKEILSFELKLLRCLVIPAKFAKGWRETAEYILKKLYEVVNYSAFPLAFVDSERNIRLYIFWKGKRDPSIEKGIEDVLLREKFNIISLEHISLKIPSRNGANGSKRNSEFVYKALKDPVVGNVIFAGIEVNGSINDDIKRILEDFLFVFMTVIGSSYTVERYMKNLEFYATRDYLTNLYNQRLFWEFLEYEVKRAEKRDYSFAIMLIDIDNFKLINDSYGHSFGDFFLNEMGKVLKETFRREDIVARYGGDEFAVILPSAGSEEASRAAQRLIKRLEEFYLIAPDGKPVSVTVSIGISVYPQHAKNSRDLFIIADNMMYRAKKEGKNRYLLPSEEGLGIDGVRDARIGLIIMEAIKYNRVIPYFQPIVNLNDSSVFAHEVLMRIKHNDSIIEAYKFIDLAENMSLIHKLDYKVIEKAVERVLQTGFKGKLFFNLSPKVLVAKDFINVVKKILLDHNFPFNRMVFEITERETVKNIDLLRSFGEALKWEGFHLAIDDFGSGFASFIYLKYLPVDYLKIEGEFVVNITLNNTDRAFVNSMVTMAKTLGIKTIAEFVESENVYKAIKSIGVDYAQGFYIGKPNPDPLGSVKIQKQ